MSGTTTLSRWEQQLSAYHDGELRGLSRWRFERELRRSPELQRELHALRFLGDVVREQDSAAEVPDLWDRIAEALPADGAAVRAPGSEVAIPVEASDWLEGLRGLFASPIRAVAAAAVAGLLAYGVLSVDDPQAGGAIRWVDAGDRAVMVIEGEESTILWVLDSPGDVSQIERGARGAV